jgi:hypothetical protein
MRRSYIVYRIVRVSSRLSRISACNTTHRISDLGSILSTGQGQALAESCFSAVSRLSKKSEFGEHTTLSRVYKMLDAMELSGTNGETDSRGICGLISKKFLAYARPFRPSEKE